MAHRPQTSLPSGRDLLIGERGNRHAVAGVLNGDGAKAALSVQVQEGVLVQVPSLIHFRRPQLNVQGISLLEVGDFHDVKPITEGVAGVGWGRQS